jgi:hypothetical protein
MPGPRDCYILLSLIRVFSWRELLMWSFLYLLCYFAVISFGHFSLREFTYKQICVNITNRFYFFQFTFLEPCIVTYLFNENRHM